MEWRTFRPSLVVVSLFLVYFSLTFLLVAPALGVVKVIPCVYAESGEWGTCTINPLGMDVSTSYFGFVLFDYIYQIVYLLLMILVPYALAAISMRGYVRFLESFQ